MTKNLNLTGNPGLEPFEDITHNGLYYVLSFSNKIVKTRRGMELK